ncbi:hypothetical protein TanjilG_23374 [Lupinus angustifolius]|uniref:Uncharacterized protein n=1 Tax=Lupinus angustifolius TaxID=3871 RepID=A0A4P1R9D3_LUPAN|nr:PREDICTED: myosin-11-like [Lupinus angustifolius]XP_019454319.1 PREDICTED: myosin-11-like [Lupinus angustifolius]OIW05588.1 hypothetical protein TanjilG_23374 [Lupinus angustifolius]
MSTPSSPPKSHHHPPPPPTPRILNFRRRERVERSDDGLALEEQKWKFQAEMLRAECNLLRMEKEIAVKKLERTRSRTQKILTSALNTLLSGRIKICEGMDISMVLDEEIHELTEKLQKLQRRSGNKDSDATRNYRNFDKQVSVLQRQLKKIGGSSDEIYLKEFQEMEKISFSIKRRSTLNHNLVASGKLNVDILRRKMEVLSKGILLQRMEEEYNSLLFSSNSSLASSASTSKRIEFQDSSSIRVPPQKEKVSHEGNRCSGHCKTIVQRIVEQVRAETEQWSQMQEMLGQVREEMEELQASRDFWEDQAVHSEFQIQSLHNAVQEWRQRAVSSESKAKELEAKLSMLSGELESLRKEKNAVQGTTMSPIPPDTQNELEKRIVVCCSKENSKVTENSNRNEVLRNAERRPAHAARGVRFLAPKRSPFQDIGNNSSLSMRQNGKTVFPLYCYLSSDVEKTH